VLTIAKYSRNDLRKYHKAFCGLYVLLLLKDYPGSRLCGHRDLSPDLNHNGEIEPEEWVKQCPCFDAATILTEPPPPNPACL
jgi:N-acetylmuramoyl-L-alanine amidase